MFMNPYNETLDGLIPFQISLNLVLRLMTQFNWVLFHIGVLYIASQRAWKWNENKNLMLVFSGAQNGVGERRHGHESDDDDGQSSFLDRKLCESLLSFVPWNVRESSTFALSAYVLQEMFGEFGCPKVKCPQLPGLQNRCPAHSMYQRLALF